MKTADWHSIVTTKALLIGENSTLQWKDEVIEHAMFLDYYFDAPSYDLGERSRYSEAKTIFETLLEITDNTCRPEQVHGTLLSNDFLKRSPKGKHILIPEKEAHEGYTHIKSILKHNPTIEYIFVMGLQANYYLQKFGFYNSGENTDAFLKGAEPRRVGISAEKPYYQPVNAKPFREICFKKFTVKDYPQIKIIPILPVKSYPLTGSELVNFGENFKALKQSFKNENKNL
ncbi:MAG: hypothetical protein R3Y26_09875 [Rikenellaceae bacterium]